MVATALVEFDLTTVTIADPVQVLEAIPNVRDPEKLALLLSGPLDHNAEYLCTARQPQDCGRLQPEVVAVLFDADRFRLDLFLAPSELLIAQLNRDRYLPASSTGFSMLHNVRSSVFGSDDNNAYRIASESILAYKQSRIRSRYAVSNEGVTLNGLSFRHDRNDMEVEVGSFRTAGRNLAFTSDVDVVGARIATSRKTRTDLAASLGTPLYVFLHERSRVDVFRGDELIDSRYYNAGNQQIDTTEFPDGAYDVSLRITGLSGDVSEDNHFFVRSGELPPKGEPTYYAEAGTAAETTNRAVPTPTGDVWVRAGASHRLSERLAISNEVMRAGAKTIGTSGVFGIHRKGYVYAGAMASDAGDYGASLRAGWRSEKVNAQLDVRAVEAVADRLGFNPIPESYTQATATVSVPMKKGRLVARARVSERQGKRETQVGVSYYRSVVRRNGWALDFSLDAQHADGRSSVRAGVHYRWRNGRNSVVARPQVAFQSGASGGVSNQFDARWSQNVHGERVGNYSRTAFVNYNEDQSVLGARFQAQNFPLSDLELGYQRSQGTAAPYYTANGRFSIATAGGKTTVSRSRGQSGAVVIHIDGNVDDKFEVVVNDRVVDYAWPGRGNVISLRPYETYRVRVKPAGASIVGFDEREHSLTLYPGNVHELSFSAKSLVVLVGQLVDGSGTPIAHARFDNVQGWGATDASGWFQVEATGFEPLAVTLRNGSTCTVTLPEVEVQQDMAMVDAVQCVGSATRGPP